MANRTNKCVECGEELTYAPGNIAEWQCTNRACVFHYHNLFADGKVWEFMRASLPYLIKREARGESELGEHSKFIEAVGNGKYLGQLLVEWNGEQLQFRVLWTGDNTRDADEYFDDAREADDFINEKVKSEKKIGDM